MRRTTTEEKRRAWREGFNPRAPLASELDWPYTPAWQIAHVMGVSIGTVYNHGARYAELMAEGRTQEASRYVPCIVYGWTKRFPTQAFIDWWETAGGTTLRALVIERVKCNDETSYEPRPDTNAPAS
jgi:hypothetical protein